MKFEINRHLLDNTLANVSKGLSTKTPLPVLTGILLIAKNNKLMFITTNKEISIQIILEASNDLDIIEDGSCVVPGKYFVDIVKKIEGEKVQVTLFDDVNIKIISNKSDFTLIALDKNIFPKTNFEVEGSFIRLTCKDLKQIVRQTSFACATSENRVILTSVNFLMKDSVLTVIATDSFRLAKKTFTFEESNEMIQMNIPCRSIEEFVKIIPDTNEELEIYISNNHVLFKYNNLSFVSRLVEGLYPSTVNLFPHQFLLSAKFNRQELISAVDRASLFTDASNLTLVKLSFKGNRESVEIASNSTEIGRVVETVNLIDVSDEIQFQIAFSANYILDAAKAFNSDEITLNFTGEIKAAVITSDEEPSLVQLLIPVKTF